MARRDCKAANGRPLAAGRGAHGAPVRNNNVVYPSYDRWWRKTRTYIAIAVMSICHSGLAAQAPRIMVHIQHIIVDSDLEGRGARSNNGRYPSYYDTVDGEQRTYISSRYAR